MGGVQTDFVGATNYTTNVIFEDCDIYENGTEQGGASYHNIYTQNISNWTIRRSKIRNSAPGLNPGSFWAMGWNMRYYSDTILIERCEFYDNYNAIHNDAGATPSNITVRNSIIRNNRNGGINLNGTATPVVIYNNTFVNNGTSAGGSVGLYIPRTSGWMVKNNIGYADTAVVPATGYPFSVINGGEGNTFDNNDWYFTGSANPIKYNGSGISLATWQGKPGNPDAHGLNSDPLFVTNYSNLQLQSASPAKDTGANLASVGVTDDYAGTSRPQGAAYDIGAYEYGGPATPSGITVIYD